MLPAIRTGRRPMRSRVARTGETLVRVHGGYNPDVVHARAGEPVFLTFLREETAACSERVVFPAFGKSAMLPYRTKIVVELPPRPRGVYEFTCAMNLLRGRLVLD